MSKLDTGNFLYPLNQSLKKPLLFPIMGLVLGVNRFLKSINKTRIDHTIFATALQIPIRSIL